MITPTPIPDHLAKRLSTQAQRILDRVSIRSCEELLAFREEDFSRIKQSGARVLELKRLQKSILEQYPHLLCHCSRQDGVTPRPTKPSALGPANWSILNRTLPDLCRLPPPCQPGSVGIVTLSLPAADLERLRSIAVFPEDPIRLLYSLTTGYLIETGLSDAAISTMLAFLASTSGPAGAAPPALPWPDVADLSLYAGLPPDLVDLLVVPGFRFPALLGAGSSENSTVPWSAVANITERTVVQKLGFSVTALGAVRYLWQLQERAVSIAESALAGLPTSAYGDFALLADGYLQFAVSMKYGPQSKGRPYLYRQLLGARLRLLDGRKWSLRELGEGYGVTRERMRQVESELLAVLKGPKTLRHLDYLWHLLDHLLETGGGARYLRELGVALRDMQGWSALPEEALASIMELSPDYRVVWDHPRRVALKRPGCVDCGAGVAALLKAMETPGRVLSFDDALGVMLKFCQGERCPELRKIKAFSKSLLNFLADSTPELHVRHELLSAGDTRQMKKTHPVLEHVVLAAGDAIHYQDVWRQFNQAVPENPLSARRIHGMLAASPLLLLWGQGAFKHRELIRVPTALIAEIQQDVAAALDSDDIPFLCLNGRFFTDYEERLRVEGVPNPPALYSCMRVVGSATLTFTEYPYALKKDGPGLRPPIEAVLERFVSSRSGPVASKELWAFARLKLGVPEAQIAGHLGRARNLVVTGRRFWSYRVGGRAEER